MAKPLTVERFIEAFRLDSGWKCQPGTRIHNDLTAFATERMGSTRDILELLTIFKMATGAGDASVIRNSAKIEALP